MGKVDTQMTVFQMHVLVKYRKLERIQIPKVLIGVSTLYVRFAVETSLFTSEVTTSWDKR